MTAEKTDWRKKLADGFGLRTPEEEAAEAARLRAQEEAERDRQRREEALAKLPKDPRKEFRDKARRPMTDWRRCPRGRVAISVHSYLNPYEVKETEDMPCDPSETFIYFPERLRVSAHACISLDGAIPIEVAQNYGWQIVWGLSPNDLPGWTGGHTLTIPYNGYLLVPPPGLWSANLPERVQRNNVRPDRSWGWFDIFEINVGHLAWEDTSYQPRQGWTCNDGKAYRHIDIRFRPRWWFHVSIPGLIELLNKMYPEGLTSVFYDAQRDSLTIAVPHTDVGSWVGSQGSRIKVLAEWLGVRRINVNGY